MTEIGTILRNDGPTVIVECRPGVSCASCKSPLCKPKNRVFQARNSGRLELAEGDLVEVFLAPAQALRSGFVVFILPLVLFGAAYAGTAALLPSTSDDIRVLAGLGGLAAGFIAVFLAGKKLKDLPEVTRKLAPGEILSEEKSKENSRQP
jgi:positive regulator of sigma E activity